jgi:hypothetical protein
MKKYLHIILKIAFSLVLFFPVLGILGIFPPPTRDLYNTDIAFAFIEMLTETGYINYIMGLVFITALGALWMRREALAAAIVLPITLNIVGFHAFLDGGLFTEGAIIGNLFLLLNLYFIWKNRAEYKHLWMKKDR